MVVGLTTQQQRINEILGKILLRSKIERQTDIIEMNKIIQLMTADQLIEVIKSNNVAKQLRFLIPAGAFGETRELLFTRIAALEARARQ